jgi:hypothetical protein
MNRLCTYSGALDCSRFLSPWKKRLVALFTEAFRNCRPESVPHLRSARLWGRDEQPVFINIPQVICLSECHTRKRGGHNRIVHPPILRRLAFVKNGSWSSPSQINDRPAKGRFFKKNSGSNTVTICRLLYLVSVKKDLRILQLLSRGSDILLWSDREQGARVRHRCSLVITVNIVLSPIWAILPISEGESVSGTLWNVHNRSQRLTEKDRVCPVPRCFFGQKVSWTLNTASVCRLWIIAFSAASITDT